MSFRLNVMRWGGDISPSFLLLKIYVCINRNNIRSYSSLITNSITKKSKGNLCLLKGMKRGSQNL